MTVWFVSRHPGALEWARRHGIALDRHVAHLDIGTIQPGDFVLGSLPVNLAADICERGAEYWHLSLSIAAADRGREMSADDLDRYQAALMRYQIRKVS